MPPTVVSLRCPNCGSSLQIPPNINNFACGFCGSSVEVHREGGIVSLARLEEKLSQIDRGIHGVSLGVERLQPGVSNTADELAVQRLDKEYEDLRNQLMEVKSSGQGCAMLLVLLGVFIAAIGLYAISNRGEPMILPVGAGAVALGIFISVADGRRVARDRAPLLARIEENRREREIRISKLRSL